MIDTTRRSLLPYLVATATLIALAPAALGRESELLRGSDSKLQLHQPAVESNRYLVALHDDRGSVDAIARTLAGDYGFAVLTTWRRGIRGFLVEADRDTARRLAADPRVRFVEQDVELGDPELRVADGAQSAVQAVGPSGPPVCFDDAGVVNLGVALNPYPAGSAAVDWGPQCPADPSCVGNWGLDRIDDRQGLDGSFLPTAGPYEVDVFVIDSGIRLDHFELSGVMVDEIRIGPGDFAPFYHGTHVTGIVAGKNFGVARQNIRLHSLNIGRTTPTSVLVMAFEAIFEARRAGVPTVATVSINSDVRVQQSRSLAEVVRRAVAERVTVINSAGNVRSNGNTTCASVSEPAESANSYSMFGGVYPRDVIIVGASNDEDGLYCVCDTAPPDSDCASRIGTAVDLFAPGAEIVSTSALADDAICLLSGTSMAAPHVAGAAALFLSRFPQASPSTVEKALRRSATRAAVSGAGSGGRLLFVGPYATNLPVAGDQYLMAHAGDELLIPFADLVADDVDWHGRALTVTGVSGAVNGTAQIVANDTVRFTVSPQAPPSTATASTARFAYTVTNGVLNDTARVRIIVLPRAQDDEVVFGGTASSLDIDLATLLANDGGAATPVVCPDVETKMTQGSVTPLLDSDQQQCLGYQYKPPSPSFAGTTSFDYLLFGRRVRATVTVHWNDPAFPTPPRGSVIVNYPGHHGTGQVLVPVGAYLAAWVPSDHTGITEYELIEEMNGVSQVVYRGPQTFYAVSGRSDGVRSYTARACTPSACSQPSMLSDGGPDFIDGSSRVKTAKAGCLNGSACNPRRGLWHDPARSGNGIDLQRSSDGRWHLMLFTYREADATPIWYQAQPAWIVGTCPSGVAGSYCMVAALEALRSVPGATVPPRRTPFGFAVLSFQSSQAATLSVYAFEEGVAPGNHGFEPAKRLFYSNNFRFLAGENQGATGNWQPTAGDGTGLVITQVPPSNGYVHAFATVYFFRPDGSPTWVTTRNGTMINYPWARYYGIAYPLFRRGINLCLGCSGAWDWLDANPRGSTTIDVGQPLTGTTGTVRVILSLGSGVDPAFPGGYGHFYAGGIRKVNP